MLATTPVPVEAEEYEHKIGTTTHFVYTNTPCTTLESEEDYPVKLVEAYVEDTLKQVKVDGCAALYLQPDVRIHVVEFHLNYIGEQGEKVYLDTKFPRSFFKKRKFI